MGKLRKTTLIIGEGPTEFFYFKSLADEFRGLTLKPDCPKHTSLKELEAKIKDGVNDWYSRIFCVVDMDSKVQEPERSSYKKLKQKYMSPIDKPKKGINCEVKFFETHNCTELFFLYYFRFTTRIYESQDALVKDLNDFCDYKKTIEFFRKCHGLHPYFEKNGGKLADAIANANQSLSSKATTGRDHTYSELGRLFDLLKKMDA